MSKKDYEAIAEAIRVANLPLRNLDDFTVRRIVEAIASALAADNPAFNSKHFFDAVFAEPIIRVRRVTR